MSTKVTDLAEIKGLSKEPPPKQPPSTLGPLWIIGMFLSFTESVLGIAVFQTTGGIQMALTAFVLVFPALITFLFFAVLWWRPYVLYPPSVFGTSLDVERYVRAMQGGQRGRPLGDEVAARIRETLESESVVLELRKRLTGKEAKAGEVMEISGDLVEYLTGALEKGVRDSLIKVDSRPLLGREGRAWELVYRATDPVSGLLDEIWFELRGHVKAFSYADDWLLREKESGKDFWALGKPWARTQGLRNDNRPIKEAGIAPGVTLEIIRPPWSDLSWPERLTKRLREKGIQSIPLGVD